MKKIIFVCCLFCCFYFLDANAQGNKFSQSLNDVKKILLNEVFFDNKKTLYCNATFDKNKNIIKSKGFKLPNLSKVNFYVYEIDEQKLNYKARRMEWEHIVPAQNFGKTFNEWQFGDKDCVSNKGKRFKGRGCAEQENEEFRYMYADMYNLYPSIGAVNYLRSNFNFTQFGKNENIEKIFGECDLKIYANKVEPRDGVKGIIARTYFYMEDVYPRYKIAKKMRRLLKEWMIKYPVSKKECQRAARIEDIQGNENKFIKNPCLEKGWYNK